MADAAEGDLAVLVDGALDLNRLTRADDCGAVGAAQCGSFRCGLGWSGSAHGQVGEVLGREFGGQGADDGAVAGDVDAAQVDPDGDGAPGHALVQRDDLAVRADRQVPARGRAGLELDASTLTTGIVRRLDHINDQR